MPCLAESCLDVPFEDECAHVVCFSIVGCWLENSNHATSAERLRVAAVWTSGHFGLAHPFQVGGGAIGLVAVLVDLAELGLKAGAEGGSHETCQAQAVRGVLVAYLQLDVAVGVLVGAVVDGPLQ